MTLQVCHLCLMTLCQFLFLLLRDTNITEIYCVGFQSIMLLAEWNMINYVADNILFV